MYSIKSYTGNYDKAEFYSIMGKFFAERVYRRALPYLINDNEKVWYLYFLEDELVGFCGVRISDEFTTFSDIYVVDKQKKSETLDFMCNHLFKLYMMENIRVLSENKEEINIWLKLGFEIIGQKGRYQNLTWVRK